MGSETWPSPPPAFSFWPVAWQVANASAEQDNVILRRDPAERLQLISLIYLMTDQLDAVIERCNLRWLDGEEKV
ncbi:hypothetical protein [Pantoea sp. SGAir0184]